jgi:hypothetical protein
VTKDPIDSGDYTTSTRDSASNHSYWIDLTLMRREQDWTPLTNQRIATKSKRFEDLMDKVRGDETTFVNLFEKLEQTTDLGIVGQLRSTIGNLKRDFNRLNKKIDSELSAMDSFLADAESKLVNASANLNAAKRSKIMEEFHEIQVERSRVSVIFSPEWEELADGFFRNQRLQFLMNQLGSLGAKEKQSVDVQRAKDKCQRLIDALQQSVEVAKGILESFTINAYAVNSEIERMNRGINLIHEVRGKLHLSYATNPYYKPPALCQPPTPDPLPFCNHCPVLDLTNAPNTADK